MTEAEDLELIFQVLEGRGEDMSLMRKAAASVATVDVGDPTPLPGALMRTDVATLPDPTGLILPPLHNGINEPPEGKFYLPPFNTPSFIGQRQYHRLSKRVRRLATWLTGLTMCFCSLLVVLAKTW